MLAVETRRPTVVQIGKTEAIPDVMLGHEKLGTGKARMLLLGFQGEGGFSGHDPIGLGVIAERVKADHGDSVEIDQYDTQPELARTGKIDTDALAERMHAFAAAPGDAERTIALGATIYSVNYMRSTMIKYRQLCEENPPENNVNFVMGGAVPTHTDTKILRKLFPEFKFVKGEGEERVSAMIGQTIRGEEMTESLRHEYADLQDYQGADRTLTFGILHAGGMPKTEASRGCNFGNCSFCSREVIMGRGGRDFRTVPPEKIVEEIKTINGLLVEFSGNRFELADEDAFSNLEHTQELISALKTAQEEGELPRIPFGASLRVDTLLALDAEKDVTGEVSLLDQLREVGLDKVFLGVEGGSNKFLHQVAKGQTTEKIMQAIATVNSSIHTEDGEERPLELEMGYITFAYNMDSEMLRENVQFLSMVEGDPHGAESTDVNNIHARHVSSLFNNLEVRAGTNDIINIRRNIKKANDPEHRDHEKYAYLKEYDPDAHFNVNSSVFEDVPFLDPAVKRVHDEVSKFANADASLYYAVKSASRTDSLPSEEQALLNDYFLRMKSIHLRYLRNEVGLSPDGQTEDGAVARTEEDIWTTRQSLRRARKFLVNEMSKAFNDTGESETLTSVKREIDTFTNQERERARAASKESDRTTTQRGACAVISDENGRVLIVRPSGQDIWTFPGGNIRHGESKRTATEREVAEEGGLDRDQIIVGRELRRVDKINHIDPTTGHRPKLVLSHSEVRFAAGAKFNHMVGDHEIADTLWLSPDELINSPVEVAGNIISIAQDMIDERTVQRSDTVAGGEITFA